MSTDDSPESLAAQAAAWVPPWERPHAAAQGRRAAAGTEEPGEVPAVPDAPAEPEPGEVPAVPDAPAEWGQQHPTAVDAPLPDPHGSVADPNDPDIPLPDAIPAPGPPEAGPPESGGVSVDSPALRSDDDRGDRTVAPLDPSAGVVAGTSGAVDESPASVPAEVPEPAAGPAGFSHPAAVPAGAAEVSRAGERDRTAARNGAAAENPAAAEGRAIAANGAVRPARVVDGVALSGQGDDAQRDVTVDPARVVDDHELRAALEAILLVVDEPVAEMVLAQILEQPTERVAAMLEAVSAGYTAAGHGFDLRRAAGGWRLYTRPEYAAYVERFVLDGQSLRLTQAALETLAVIAYKQPVSRSRISAIRGVNCDGVMRTLVSRGLVEECGTEQESGAFLYRTTVLFLEKLGLNSVDQLPPLAPFLPDDVEEVFDAQR